MITVMKVIFSLSLSGTILYAVISVCLRRTKKFLSRNIMYYLLIIIVLRLMLPIAFEVNVLSTVFHQLEETSVYQRIFPLENQDSDNGPVILGNNVFVGDNVILGSTRNKDYDFIFYIWISAALLLLIRKITKYQSFNKYIRAGWKAVDGIEELNILSDVCERLQVRGVVELYVNPLVSSPLLLGVLKPCIVLPHLQMTEEELYYILLHEVTHYKKKDLIYKWFVQMVLCIHWFNPFIYRFSKRMNKDCEFACDESVISMLSSDEVYQYGATLIKMLKHPGQYKENIASVTLQEGAAEVKERLEYIKTYKRSTNKKLIPILLMFFMIGAAFFIGVYQEKTEDITGDITRNRKTIRRELH
jgi:beta-lactamase regulating signal transducer with metallopeptidase domain